LILAAHPWSARYSLKAHQQIPAKKKPQENPTACELTAEKFSAGAQAPSQQ